MARKRKRDKEDEELAREIAKVAGVTRYMQQVTEEDIKKQGDLYLKYASGMMGFGPQVLQDGVKTEENVKETVIVPEKEEKSDQSDARAVPVSEKEEPEEQTDAETKKSDKKTGTTGALNPGPPYGISTTPAPIPRKTTKKIGSTRAPIPEKIDAAPAPIPLSAAPALIPDIEKQGIGAAPALIPEKIDSTGELNEKPLGTTVAPNLSQDKAHFEPISLIRFINGTMNILLTPDIDNRTKTFMIIVLYKSVFENKSPVKIRSNDILKALGIHKKNQKKIPEEAQKAGIATFTVRRKGGTEVTFNEEIFNPYGKNGSNEIDRLIDIYNLSIYLKNTNEEKIEERKRIPLSETGKYVLLVSLHLAGFPLSAVTGSLLEAARNRDAEIVTAFWIYAKSSSDKIKSPGAYLIKVLNNNDTGSLSGEIMEKAKICVKAAQTIVHENYDEPELGFLKGLAQRLSLTDAYYKDRDSLTLELKTAGRKLIDECEKVLNKLPKKTV